ncbi:ABC transporter permease [Streptomyces sp. MUM 203J]|uniref:ABC transporter permease n=1 Tax=Streptomyces sp. MUM 203J TaxID=2791990 RepID=UPI001F03C910|nr:ABC transporter permease [Streptomyces sp. MUM 203J]MCH0538488.1 ABC transporter permease [Streptomyces sp. MUM 203J]
MNPTATRTPAPAQPPAPASLHAVTPVRLLRSEWHKLRSLRSTWVTLLTAVSLVLGVGLLMGTTYTSGGGDSDIDTVVLVLYGTLLSQICLAVLGILVTAGEYGTGLIRTTLTAVPHRLPVLWAKAAVLSATAFTVSLVTALLTFLTAQHFLSDTDQAASLTDDGVLRAIAGNSTGLTLLALIALGLGALLRSVPGALGAFVGGVVILPEILSALPYETVHTALRYSPTQAAAALGSATPLPNAVPPAQALLALLLWTAATLAVSAALLKHRDA